MRVYLPLSEGERLFRLARGVGRERDQLCYVRKRCIWLSEYEVEISQIYIVKINKIQESYVISQTPFTKLNVNILKCIKGKDTENINIILNEGKISIFDLEKTDLNKFIDDRYKNLSEEYKKNTFVRVISENNFKRIAEPVEGKVYIVSLNSNNEVISNCNYPFLRFDLNKNLYEKENIWYELDL